MEKYQDGSHLCSKIRRIMKISLTLALICILNISANTYAQTTHLTIEVRNGTLYDMVKQIEKQSEFLFFYNSEDIPNSLPVNLTINNKDVKVVLDYLSKEYNLTYKINDRHIFLTKQPEMTPAQQQLLSITGIVRDNTDPIPGANVVEKGTTNGTMTDMNGKFILNVHSNSILEVSYIGYIPQEVKVGKQANLTITLEEDLQSLEEVIVVGYGTQKKINLTGSVAQVSSETLKNRPITNISSGIQGLMPGVTVTAGQGRPGMDEGSIRIRGIGTLNSSEPYILIDGVESKTLNTLDPNEIENISVMKDAASAAIYGSKASNGVILVTTKRGTSGKPQLSYNGYVSFQTPTTLVERLNSYDYATLYNQALEAENKSPRFTQEEVQKFKDGSDPYKYPNTDWNDLYKTGIQHQHNLNLVGGIDYLKYMASVGYLNQQGVLPNSERQQINGRMNLDVTVSKKIAVRMNMAFIKNEYSDPTTPIAYDNSSLLFRMLNQIAPWLRTQNEDGTYPTVSDWGSPKAWLDAGMTADRSNKNFSGLLAVDYTIIDNLKATVQGSYVNNNQQYKFFKQYFQYNPNSYQGPNQLNETLSNWDLWNLDILLNYDKKWGKHNFKALFGYHAEKYNYKENSMQRKNFPNNELTDMNAGTTSTQTNGGYTRELAMLSYFGRLNYDYAGKYLLEANFRSDASSRFSPENRWGYFPSFSAAWRITEESFMENTKSWLNNLKIRGSWGLLGNQNALNDYYPWLATYSIGSNYPFNGVLQTGYYNGSFKLPSITWEKARTWGLGADMNFLNHYSISVDYYDRLTSDIIMSVPVPTEFALGAYQDNVGKVKNSGVEISLGYTNTWNDWRLMVNANVSYNKNKILDLGGVDRMIEGSYIKQIGSPINSYYAYQADGFFQSEEEAKAYMDKYKNLAGYPFAHDFKAGDLRYKDTNGDGKISSEDRIIANSTNPKVTYGMNASLGWKNFELSALFNGAAGVSRFFNTGECYGDFMGDTGHPATVWKDAWSPTNPNGTMPRIADERRSPSHSLNNVSTFWIKNTSYVRLKNLQISYTFPQSWMKQLGVSNLRVYYSGENLFTIDALNIGIDPENTDAAGGFYPILRSHSFGLNLQF